MRHPKVQVGSISDLEGKKAPLAGANGELGRLALENDLKALESTIQSISASGTIGPAEDGTYDDGLYTDFTNTTPVGTAVDRFNELFLLLVPPQAPALSSISALALGVSGKLSFGSSNTIAGYTNHPTLDINDNFTNTVNNIGIINGTTNVSGNLNSSTVAHEYAYPQYAFKDTGEVLQLKVNNVVVHSINLSTFTSGSSYNSNGSGFTLSEKAGVEFQNGNVFTADGFYYRTGTWIVNASDFTNGYNTIQVTLGSSNTNTLRVVVDSETDVVTYSTETIDTFTPGSIKHISGVKYYTGFTVDYSVLINNAYKNTYSNATDAITHPTKTNMTIANDAIPNALSELNPINLYRTATFNGTRLLNAGITINTLVARTVQSQVASTGASFNNLLVDAVADNSTISSETFNGESRRITSEFNDNLTNITPLVSYDWDSTESLNGTNIYHNNGLQYYNGRLIYPGSDFSTIANGPSSNVDYSSASGNRTCYLVFSNATARQNFTVAISSSGTSFVPVSTGVSANNITVEICCPNTTQDGTGDIEFKDLFVDYTNNDSIGCRLLSFGSNIATGLGATLGTRNTSTGGYVIVMKITASSSWTGYLETVTINWL